MIQISAMWPKDEDQQKMMGGQRFPVTELEGARLPIL